MEPFGTYAIYAGSFDPITRGHLDVIERALRVFDFVDILIGHNPAKSGLFSPMIRQQLISESLDHLRKSEDNTAFKIVQFDGLVTQYVRELKRPCVLIRGVRPGDFDREYAIADFNHDLLPSIETIYFPTRKKYQFVSSSAVKELFRCGATAEQLNEYITLPTYQALKQHAGPPVR